ncbi:MAG: YqhA family protein [Caldilineaceae bacterium]
MLIKLVGATRYLVIFPVIGLAITAAVLFVLAGIGLVAFLIAALAEGASHGVQVLPIIDLVEFVHQFLIGTVLYITAVGLYQLFIAEIDFPSWLKVDSTEQLESNLISVTVVVLAVNFLSVVFTPGERDLLNYGAGIALPIAALALFTGLRKWSQSKDKDEIADHERRHGEGTWQAKASKTVVVQDASGVTAAAASAPRGDGKTG